MIDLSVDRLAASAQLEAEAIELYEAGAGALSDPELAMLGYAFANRGVLAIPEALAGEGVRLREPRVFDLVSCDGGRRRD